jgi:hypothetical protein
MSTSSGKSNGEEGGAGGTDDDSYNTFYITK